MAPILYMYHGSPACRAVLIVSKAINLTLDIRLITRKSDCPYTKQLQKINPKRTVPTLEDNGLILCDSHAINCYLTDKYAENDSLYPKELNKRALVNDKLCFNIGVLFSDLHHLLVKLMNKQVQAIPKNSIDNICKSYSILENYLEKNVWICGDNVTIADFMIYTTVTSLHRLVKIDETKNIKIIEWLNRLKLMPCFSSDGEEVEIHYNWIDGLLQQL